MREYVSITTGQVVFSIKDLIKETIRDLVHYKVLNVWKRI